MLTYIKDFDKKTASHIDCEELTLACGSNVNMYTIKSVYDLTQFIGYGKYINPDYNVFLRGQSDTYNGNMIPSLYRNNTNSTHFNEQYNRRINQFIERISAFSGYPRITLEPLLQHYGVKTPYIDLVDNVWVALWFAVHDCRREIIKSHEYLYYTKNQNEYAYIFLMASDANRTTADRGVYEGDLTKLVDLRKSVPSYFLRPHAQHAYMLRKNNVLPNDYSDLIIGIAKIPTDLGLLWLGNNEFLTVDSLFPSAVFDCGYASLLREYPEEDVSHVKTHGSIQIIHG